MTFDADSGHSSLAGKRPTVVLNMGQTIARDRAGHGARIAQEDICTRHKHGKIMVETTGENEASVEKLKDSCRLRGDLGVTFDMHKARGPTRLKGAYSSLHRPRDHAAPDFSRTPAFAGFSSHTPVKVLPRSRSHDAMPGWTAEAVDGLMSIGDE